MTWIAPSEKDTDNAALEKRLWDAAGQFRANSGLKSQEYFLAPWERVAAPAFNGPVQGSPTGRDEFAMSEGQGGGEFYTPSSIVRLLTEVIEPYHGRILDPACGSGGMFVSSARFVSEHKKNPAAELSIHGVEKTDETGRLCRLNFAVHGFEGEIKHGGNINSYYDDPHDATGGRLVLPGKPLPAYVSEPIPAMRHEAVRRGVFRPGHHARRKRRAEFRPREMHSLRCVPVELRTTGSRKLGSDEHRLPRWHGRPALGGELKSAVEVDARRLMAGEPAHLKIGLARKPEAD